MATVLMGLLSVAAGVIGMLLGGRVNNRKGGSGNPDGLRQIICSSMNWSTRPSTKGQIGKLAGYQLAVQGFSIKRLDTAD